MKNSNIKGILFACCLLMPQLASTQGVSFPRIQVIQGDTQVVYRLWQVRAMNDTSVVLDECRERGDSLVNLVELQKAVILAKDTGIKSLGKQLDHERGISADNQSLLLIERNEVKKERAGKRLFQGISLVELILLFFSIL